MPRKNAMRDNVSAVRSRLPHLSNLPREKIELALLYYESNIDETVEAFKRNGAIEALSGWTEMTNGRGHNSNKRTNNKSNNQDNKSASSNGILRPSQRVSNIFQAFAEGGTPAITTNGHNSISNTESSRSFNEQSTNIHQTYPSTDLSFGPCLSQDSTTNNNSLLLNTSESIHNDFHATSIESKTDENTSVTHQTDEVNGHNGKSKRRRSVRTSSSSNPLDHEQTQQSSTNDNQQSKNNKPSIPNSSSSNPQVYSNNRKLLTKSTKDLQRQTSTLTNIELSFENEIKSSIKRIDDVFKQIRDIIKEREIELYLEIDKVKEQGLNIIHHRQHRAVELRQSIDRCDRMEPNEIDNLRTDIKQFVTERRYDLGEELTSAHRFQYDQSIIDALKTFGTVLSIDRKYDRARTLSTASSALVDHNSTTAATTSNENWAEKSIETTQTQMNDVRVSTTNEHNHQPLPQRFNKKLNFNGNNNENSHSKPQTNGYHHGHDDANNFQTINRRRPPPQRKYPQNFTNENNRRGRPKPPSNNYVRRNGFNNSETKNLNRNPESSQTIVPPISNS